MAFWDRFFGSAGSNAAGIAIGATAIPALRPAVQFLENEAWKLHPDMPPPAVLLAEGVAQGQVDPKSAADWAAQTGFGQAQFAAMVNVANVGPGAAYAFDMWRRGLIDKAGFETAIKRLGIEDRWVAGLEGLHDTLLSSAELGMMQQQGFIDAQRANDEGALQGVTNERQQLRFEASGLPPGVETALTMLRRNIIASDEFATIVREGHTKTKYTGVLEQLQQQILSAATAVRAHLKGHITQAEMHTRGAQWGFSPADMDLWFQSEGRPATVHEIHIGYARGASVPGAKDEQDAILQAVAQSDIRPEYGPLLYAQRFSYPSAFVLRGLAQAGELGNEAAVEQILLEIGWKPDFAKKVAAAWTGGGTATVDPHAAKAQTQLWNTTHRSYVASEISSAAATTALEAAGVAAASVPAVLSIWNEERSLIRKSLSAAQIKKAYTSQALNPATNAAWTEADAIARLLELGYDQADAKTLLAE